MAFSGSLHSNLLHSKIERLYLLDAVELIYITLDYCYVLSVTVVRLSQVELIN